MLKDVFVKVFDSTVIGKNWGLMEYRILMEKN